MFIVATLGLLAMTCWLIVFRFTGKSDSNWPLIYWGLAAAHVQMFEVLMPYAVWFGASIALFLRFEFMGRGFARLFIFVELPSLAYIGWRCITLIMANY
jgi:hypothetical protein